MIGGENELRLHRCCFTGHRPEKLNNNEGEVKKLLDSAIRQAIADGFTTFITGMARGVDIWAGQIVLELKKEGSMQNFVGFWISDVRSARCIHHLQEEVFII